MYENPPGSIALNELIGECFRLNRSLIEVAQQLTDGTGVTGTQWGVLSALGLDGAPGTVAETARRMGMARQSVQRIADVLADRGLVKYLPSPADKRAQLVEVTKAGKLLLEDLEQRQQVWLKDIAGSYRDVDINVAIKLVKNIRQHISE
jgi:DNA-binding MarR family transcriptional regulator